MLELRPNCECCDKDLPPAADAVICSFECTFCRDCADNRLGGRRPNCGGNFVQRPIRPDSKLAKNPPSTRRIFKPQGCAEVAHPNSVMALHDSFRFSFMPRSVSCPAKSRASSNPRAVGGIHAVPKSQSG